MEGEGYLIMEPNEKAMIVLAALTLGFKEIDQEIYQCTKEQLCELCAVVSSAAINQVLKEI